MCIMNFYSPGSPGSLSKQKKYSILRWLNCAASAWDNQDDLFNVVAIDTAAIDITAIDLAAIAH